MRRAYIDEEVPQMLERLEQKRLTGMTTSENSKWQGQKQPSNFGDMIFGSIPQSRGGGVIR